MSVVAEMVQSSTLEVEWQRIEVLAECLLESRAGLEPSSILVQQLRDIQHQIEFIRKQGNAWSQLVVDDLPELALDILASVYAPAINPNVALLFQDLQQSNSTYPTLAFLHRLLAFNEKEYLLAQQLTNSQGELVVRELLIAEGEGPMRQLKPHSALMPVITGRPVNNIHIPGALRIDIDASWDDLILPAAQRRMLHEYLLWIKHGNKVVEEWGARSTGGPIALFSGASGTGKTFGASVIANELGWSLYRVDLGSLISKYIGETEKNLNALFDAVQGQKILLQFDEVDALMGKRGEIKDARDRYANMEVSHLLSRIEQHQGPCILTTNLRKQIDQAFQRRFHFVVVFPRPEIHERMALWKRLIPPKAPLSNEIDYQLVAESVALTGGEIRNAANHAAILAVAESAPINLQHIAIGVWRVLQKTDGQIRQNQLKLLADFLPQEVISGERI